jgi:hypothetical protein
MERLENMGNCHRSRPCLGAAAFLFLHWKVSFSGEHGQKEVNAGIMDSLALPSMSQVDCILNGDLAGQIRDYSRSHSWWELRHRLNITQSLEMGEPSLPGKGKRSSPARHGDLFVIPSLRRLRQKNGKSEASLGYIGRPCLKKRKEREGRQGGTEGGRKGWRKEDLSISAASFPFVLNVETT